MVRTQRSSLVFLHLEQRPDAGRIAGISAAIAIHAIALMVLLAPMAAPTQVVLIEQRVRTPPDLPRKEPPPTPPVLTPVINPPVRPPQAIVQPPRPEMPSVNNEVVIENGTVAVTPTILRNETVDPGPSISTPIPGTHLEYANAPPPLYPRAAIRERMTGTVMLQVLVDIDGRPLEASIAQSSGHRELDRAALDHVLKRWTFRPAMKNGRAVQAIGLVPIAFNLR